jgi:hypothetical protein
MAAGMLAFGAGCGRKASQSAGERIAEGLMKAATGGKADVDLSGDKVTVKTKDGEMKFAGSGNLKVPDTFPKDIPLYKDARVAQTYSSGGNMSLALSSSDAAEAILDFYSKEMPSQGWAEETSVRHEKGGMGAYKKEKRQVTVSVNDTGSDRLIHLLVAAERE